MSRTSSFLKDIRSFDKDIWLMIAIQMIEKMAFVVTLIQIPVYISQKDIEGGLYLGHDYKGYLLFFWAIVQRATPIFTGAYSDRIGYKRSLFISTAIILSSYLLLANIKSFEGMVLGVILLGFGSGIFLPALQGALSVRFERKVRSSGWGIYFMLLNLAVFFAPPISKMLKETGWEYVFLGSAIIISANFILVALTKFDRNISSERIVLKEVFSTLFSRKILPFVLAMSGFTLIYMQFYETYPNFFIDWIDTRNIVDTLSLPSGMLTERTGGEFFSYEWIRNFNSGIIIIFIAIVSKMMSRFNVIYAIMTGISLTMAGLLISGISIEGSLAFSGIVIYTFGELITNPKFTQHLNDMAPNGKNAMYMSYLNISFGIGLSGGALLGGFLYNSYGEKATLAAKYLSQKYGITNTELTESFDLLIFRTGLGYSETLELLWNIYEPWRIWIPFILIGLISLMLLGYYVRNVMSDQK